jgi:hypothetical protein
MRKLIAFLFLFSLASTASAFSVNGRYFQQISCSYEYNQDFGAGGYIGIYKGASGDVYSWFFPSDSYSWCPY